MSPQNTQNAQKEAPAVAGSVGYEPFGEGWTAEMMKLRKPELISLLREAWIYRKQVRSAVPTNWTDPLLTGKAAALHGKPGSWNCQDIERLLNGVAKRLMEAPNTKLEARR